MYEMKHLAHLLLTARQINPGISDVMHQSQGVFFRICTHAQTHIQVYVRLCVTMCVRETVKQRQRAKEIKKESNTEKENERESGRDGWRNRKRQRENCETETTEREQCWQSCTKIRGREQS